MEETEKKEPDIVFAAPNDGLIQISNRPDLIVTNNSFELAQDPFDHYTKLDMGEPYQQEPKFVEFDPSTNDLHKTQNRRIEQLLGELFKIREMLYLLDPVLFDRIFVKGE